MIIVGIILIVFAAICEIAAIGAMLDGNGLAALLHIGAATSLGIGTGLIGLARALRDIIATLRRAAPAPSRPAQRAPSRPRRIAP